jgi:hypothetical protein
MYDDPKSTDVWLTCPNCHKYMVPLKTYEIQDSSNPGVSTNPITFLLFGWWGLLYSLVFGQAAFAGEKMRLKKDKEEILPQFPNSQICPHCYTVTKRL